MNQLSLAPSVGRHGVEEGQVNNRTLFAFLISLTVHLAVIGVVPLRNIEPPPPELLRVDLIEISPRPEIPPPQPIEAPMPRTKAAAPIERPKELKAAIKREPKRASKAEVAKAESPPSLSAPIKEVPVEAPPTAPAKFPPPSFSSNAESEGGGSDAGAGALFGKGDVGVVPRPGTAGGGGGTATSGLGRGSGAPGLPAQTAPLRTNREAKPIQTVRAAYPPMALRAGLESDVTLRIEVNARGEVTKAEIVKSGGAGFDEEALKAVKQSRFEPAERAGEAVAAEFTYIYRFRLQK
jgi:protein TonB